MTVPGDTLCDCAVARAEGLVQRYYQTRQGGYAARCRGNPDFAAGRCIQEGRRFLAWVRGLDEDDDVSHLWVTGRTTGCGEDGHCRSNRVDCDPAFCPTGHFVAVVNGVVVDLTGAQFGTAEPVVEPLDTFKTRWRSSRLSW